MFPNYQNCTTELRLYFKPGTGHVLGALVGVPWHPETLQRLPLLIDGSVSFAYHQRQVTIAETELMHFWQLMTDVFRVITKETNLECRHPEVRFTGSLQIRGDYDKIIDMIGGPNDSRLCLGVSAVHINTELMGLLEPESTLAGTFPDKHPHRQLILEERGRLTGWIESRLFDGRRTASVS